MVTIKDLKKYYSGMVEFGKYPGINLSVHESGKVSYTVNILDQYLTSPDQFYGGIISVMMDAVLGISLLSLAVTKDNFYSMLEFEINYKATANPGDSLEAVAEIESRKSEIITASGCITEVKSGRLIARGAGSFMQFPLTKKKEILARLKN